MFRALGHSVRLAPTLDAAEHAGQARGVDLVVVDNDAACSEGRAAIRRLRAPEGGPRVLWTGAGVRSGLGLVFVEVPDALLVPPLTMSSVGTTLARIEHRGAGDLEGRLVLDNVDGSFEHFPPFRVLWAAAAARASGRLELYLDEVEREVHLHDGQVVAARGFPDVLADGGVQGDEDDDLETLIGRAIGAGLRPDLAMQQAATGLAATIAGLVGRSGGMVFFDSMAEPPERALPLSSPLPQSLADALGAARPADDARALLQPHRDEVFAATNPGFGPTGLPPVALRLWRAASNGALLDELVSGDDDATWLAADLLLQLGLVRLQVRDVPDPVVDEAADGADQPSLRERIQARVEEVRTHAGADDDAAADSDPVLAELRAERQRLADLHPAEVLGITKLGDLDDRGIAERFRLLSARFHPDRFARESKAVQREAQECFAIVGDAFEVLQEPTYREEALARLRAAAAGRVYVSDGDRRKALLLFARGDVSYRRKSLPEAIEAFEAAHAVNPHDWRTIFMLNRARFDAGVAPAEECAMALMDLQAPEGRQRSDLLYHLGEMLLAADRQKAAFDCFERAVQEWDQNVDAKRRLRLRKLRRDGVEAVRVADAEERELRAQQRAEDAGSEQRGSKTRNKPAPSDGSEASNPGGVGGMLSGLFRRRGG